MDYTTTTDVFAYGDVSAPSANQTAVMAEVITAVSRRIDKMCTMNFSYTTYTNTPFPVRVDKDGLLTFYVPSPTVTTLTSASLRIGNQAGVLSLDLTNAEIEPHDFGTKIMLFGQDFFRFRETTLKLKATCAGGWATLNAVPYDFNLAATQYTWFVFKKREAPMQTTAVPELGIITLPAAVQPEIMDTFKRYTWWWS